MRVELTPQECELLLELVDSALREIGPQIHHTLTSEYKDHLKAQRRDLQRLQARLSGQEELGPTAAGAAPGELVGTA